MNCAKNNCALIVAVKKKDCQLSCPCELNFALRHSNAMPNWQKHCFQMNSYVWLALDRIRGFLCAASSLIFLSGSPQFSSEISNPRNVPSCNWIFSQLERSGGIARTKIDKSEERLGCNVGKWESLKKMSQILIVHKSCKSWKIILSVGKMEESEPDLKLKWNILENLILILKCKYLTKSMDGSESEQWTLAAGSDDDCRRAAHCTLAIIANYRRLSQNFE